MKHKTESKYASYVPVPGSRELLTGQSGSGGVESAEIEAAEQALIAGKAATITIGPVSLQHIDLMDKNINSPAIPVSFLQKVLPQFPPDSQLVLLHLLNTAFAKEVNFSRISIQETQKLTNLTKYRIHKALAYLTNTSAISLIHRNTKGTLYVIDLITKLSKAAKIPREGMKELKYRQSIKTQGYESDEESHRAFRKLLDLPDPATATPAQALAGISKVMAEYQRLIKSADLSDHTHGADTGPSNADGTPAISKPVGKGQVKTKKAKKPGKTLSPPVESPVTEESFPRPGTTGPKLTIRGLADKFYSSLDTNAPDHEMDAAMSQITLLLEDGFSREDVAEGIEWFTQNYPEETTLTKLPYFITQALG